MIFSSLVYETRYSFFPALKEKALLNHLKIFRGSQDGLTPCQHPPDTIPVIGVAGAGGIFFR